MYALRILTDKPARFILTLTGLALCIILILFILGIYKGVAQGSIEYIKSTPADLWILHENNNNILRGTSILPAYYADVIRRDSLVNSVTPVLLFFTNLVTDNANATILLAGYVPGSAGGPPGIESGRAVKRNDEIVLDKSFAKKHKILLGSKVRILKDTLKVVGISIGTNAYVAQYAFVTLDYEQSIIDLPGLSSFFIVRAKNSSSIDQLKRNINKKFAGSLSLYEHGEFIKNNITEMDAGILPFFSAIAVIGSVVIAIILSLILSVNIIERRRDFAVMKILGSPQFLLDKIVLQQSIIISSLALFFAVIIYLPLLKLIEYISPEIAVPFFIRHVVIVSAANLVISVLSSLLASRKTRRIYPLEVFQ